MTDRAPDVIDIDAERRFWKQRDGAPGYPYSSHWELILNVGASAVLKNPYGGPGAWRAAIRAAADARQVLIPGDAFEVIVSSCLGRWLAMQDDSVTSQPGQ